MLEVFSLVRRVAPSDATVLIRGESGTGKELIAKAIHYASARASAPLIRVNCAALPETLLESELFGHEKGAFTGALAARKGRFELADGGSLFLDEIGDLSLPLQAKLLRVLQEREFERIGSSKSIRVDVRILTATHRDLEALVKAGQFREDLYYRLNVVMMLLPALRERREDLALLMDHFPPAFCSPIAARAFSISAV
jgi:Nif-specific regulatory protein